MTRQYQGLFSAGGRAPSIRENSLGTRLPCTHSYYYNLFSSYYFPSACVKKIHRCVQNANSTTQLWFGMSKTSKASTTQPPPGDTTSGGSVEASEMPDETESHAVN